jgi:hypothetical protein
LEEVDEDAAWFVSTKYKRSSLLSTTQKQRDIVHPGFGEMADFENEGDKGVVVISHRLNC